MADVDNKVKMIVEGLLLAAGRPLTLDNIAKIFDKKERPDKKELKAVMESIADECDDRGFELKEVASGYRFQVKQELSEWVAKLWEERPPRYTRALLETLVLIAYRQPITRGDIEEIRGVSVSPNIIRTLIDRDWIRVVGHRDVPGRPAMFATTKVFLDYFNLMSLQELPPLSEIKDLEDTEPELDLSEELSKSRILDMPDESEDEDSRALTEAEEAQLIAEEEAVELSKKPLDEILRMGVPEELLQDDEKEALEEEGAEELDEEDIAEIDSDIGLTDDDIAVNEEFEKNLKEESSTASEESAPADEELENEEAEKKEAENEQHESNVIPLRSNENSAIDSSLMDSSIEEGNQSDDEVSEEQSEAQSENLNFETAESSSEIDFATDGDDFGDDFSGNTSEITLVGDDPEDR